MPRNVGLIERCHKIEALRRSEASKIMVTVVIQDTSIMVTLETPEIMVAMETSEAVVAIKTA